MTEAEPTYGIHHVLIPMKILKNKSDVSARLSRLVVSYCQIHEMDAESFDLLTSDDMLPTIAFDAAPKLIQLKESLVAATPDNESDLEKRCFAAIEAIVDKINFDDPSDPTLQFMRTRPAKRIMETMSALGLAQQKELTRVRDDNIVSI